MHEFGKRLFNYFFGKFKTKAAEQTKTKKEMKAADLRLLKKLKSEYTDKSDLPLQNIKNEIGSIANVVGNPLSKTEITLTCTKNYFLNGTQIVPTALPVSLRTSLPAHYFGLTDYYSGFSKSLSIIKPVAPWNYSDGLGERLGVDMARCGNINGIGSAGFWNVVGADFAFGISAITCSGLHSAGLGQAEAKLEKTNFFQLYHRYRITVELKDITYAAAKSVSLFGYVPIMSNYGSAVDNEAKLTYDIIAYSTSLTLNSNFLAFTLSKITIQEIIGVSAMLGEPSVGIYGFTKNNCYSTNVQRGDYVSSYVAVFPNIPAWTVDTYVCEIIIHCENVAYGTFLNSFVSDLITIDRLRYIVPIANIDQFLNPLSFIYQTLFGKTNVDTIDARMFITSKDFQQQIADIPLSLPIDKNISMTIPMMHTTNRTDLVLFVEKVEPLTNHKI